MVERSVFYETPAFLLPLGNSTATFSFWKSLQTYGAKVFADFGGNYSRLEPGFDLDEKKSRLWTKSGLVLMMDISAVYICQLI